MSIYMEQSWKEEQITFSPHSHQLTNINVCTPDSKWVVYDVRPGQSEFSGTTIERVNIDSGEVETLYQADAGACVGVATVSAQLPLRYLFIHGPENPDSTWEYDFHHRRGVIVTEAHGVAETVDALDITLPFTPGALRGGSHVHVFSPDGSRISFTYNDHVMHELDLRLDQRNVGIALPLGAVIPPCYHPREYSGSHFCVLVTKTTVYPRCGSDEISRAYEEGWIGRAGYWKSDGTRQRWALAFIGDTRADDNSIVPEVYLVDLPENDADYQQAGEHPLQGTATTLPAPPAGVVQRRLTYTARQPWPGVVTQPRHWLRSSPDGSAIAFLLRDKQGVIQLCTISPTGGDIRQITRGSHSVQSAFSWSPDGGHIALVMDNSIMLCDMQSGELIRLTKPSDSPPLADAVVFSADGEKIIYLREREGLNQIFKVQRRKNRP